MNNTLRTTPQQERALATINSIISASKRVLLAEGYEKFTTNRVAAESGFNIGTVYRYFPDKEELIIKLYEERLDESLNFLNSQLTSGTTWDSLDDFFGHMLEHYILSHSDTDHATVVELTKAARMNQHIQKLDRAHDTRIRNVLFEAVEEIFGEVAERRQIQYWLDLGLHLALLVSMEPPETREFVATQAVNTMIGSVRVHMDTN